MMPMVDGERTAIVQTMLPEDPEPGFELILPEGQTIGGANVINIWKGSKLLGSTSQVAPMPNASGKYSASRVNSKTRLKEGDIIHLKAWQHNYISIQFIESFGWIGKKTNNKPLILMDKHMRVLATFSIGEHAPGYYLYEQICLEAIKGAESNEARTTNPTSRASRTTTSPGSGSSTASGSDGSTSRPKPTPRERTNRYGKPRGRYASSGNDKQSGD